MAIVNTNFNSTIGLFNFNKTADALSVSIERLSSGLRVNRAGDDPVGSFTASLFQNQIQGYRSATTNAEQASSLVQTGYDAMNEMKSVLLRMKDIALKASNLTWGASTSTLFSTLNTEFTGLRTELGNKATKAAFNNMKMLDGSLSSGVNFQVGPDNAADNRIALTVPAVTLSYIADGNSTNLMVTANVTSQGRALSALSVVNASYDRLNNIQVTLGTAQERINSIINDLKSSELNVTSAKSNITDADMASEITMFTRNQIISQAGASVLAQANTVAQRVVNILDKISS